MNIRKIAFYDAKPYDEESFKAVNGEFGYEIKYHHSRLGLDTAILASGSEFVCAFVNDIIDKDVVEILYDQGVKLIALRCAGYNNVNLHAVYKKIHVVRVPAYSPYAVAEHAVGLILALNRKIHKAYYRTRDNNFNINGFLGFDMHGKTAGIIGTGKIGRVLIDILKGFGMKILAFDSYPNPEAAGEQGFEYTDLDTIYSKCDIISLHCPLVKETYHLINEDAIKKMKDSVMIINTSRGALIDTVALIEGLKAKKVGSAGLDVYEEESEYFFEDFSGNIIDDDILARLLTFPNVLVTSHQAFFTREALHNIAHTTLSNIRDFIDGKPLVNEICYKCGAESCNKKITGKCF
jgi:D-lactate dehydrogenase